MSGQGRYLSDLEIKSMIYLLSRTDMSIAQIAKRMNCSKSAILSINRRFGVRNYKGKRTTWEQSERVS
jgi:hypothetical protein